MTDARFGRRQEWDERSKQYPIRALVPQEIRGRSWPLKPRFDQGREPSCVGFGWAHELAAQPVVVPADYHFAYGIYREAQISWDEWPGSDYEGTSVLAGAKTVKHRGFCSEYRWAFGIDDVLRTLSHAGPVVLGTDWTDSMSDPRPSGLLEVDGNVVGGHCCLARGLLLKPRLKGEVSRPVVRLTNSWGRDWGRDGDCFIRVEDLEGLLLSGGEACIPMGRFR